MQDIATKIARVRPVAVAAGLSVDQMRHLIHGTGGSPRRAKRAIKAGFAEVLADAYEAALQDEGSHAKAVAKCNAMWTDLMPGRPTDDEDSEGGATDADPQATVH